MDEDPKAPCIMVNGKLVTAGIFDSPETALAIYTAIWQNMERENTLINHRLTWSLLITAGFITAQAFLANAILENVKNREIYFFLSSASFFMAFMSAAALFATFRIMTGVEAAIRQLSYLKYFYFHSRRDGENLFESWLSLPRPFGEQTTHRSGNNASRVIPPVLIVFWGVVLFIECLAGVLFLVKNGGTETTQTSAAAVNVLTFKAEEDHFRDPFGAPARTLACVDTRDTTGARYLLCQHASDPRAKASALPEAHRGVGVTLP